MSLPTVVSIHTFTAGRFDKERLADEIARFAEDSVSTLPGLVRATVLSEYAGSHVAIVVEWESHEAWAAAIESLNANERMTELSAGTGQATNEAYTLVTVVHQP